MFFTGAFTVLLFHALNVLLWEVVAGSTASCLRHWTGSQDIWAQFLGLPQGYTGTLGEWLRGSVPPSPD